MDAAGLRRPPPSPLQTLRGVGPENCRIRDASIKLLLTKCAHPVQVWRIESFAGPCSIPQPAAWMLATGDQLVQQSA